MAWQWRIRYKLMLGLGLAVGIMSLILIGTLQGLLSYVNTMKSIGSKEAEQVRAMTLVDAVGDLLTPDPSIPLSEEGDKLRQKIDAAQTALTDYEKQLQDTLNRNRDPDKGLRESDMISKLNEDFTNLREALHREEGRPAVTSQGSIHLVNREEIDRAIKQLQRDSRDLHHVVHDSIEYRITDAKYYYRNSLSTVIATSVCGVLLMFGFFGFFYRWLFYPVRDLQQGVARIAQGDFDHGIEVHSGDEMEDLAAAFNNMTDRLREMYRDLAHQVNERSRQLVRSERLASVGFLAAGVAHEINNPLASIAFCSEALESRLADVLTRSPNDSEVITKYLKMIQEEAFRCKAITQRLLEFSRSGERRREPTDLAELIQSVLDMVGHLQNYKDKHILFDPPAPVFAWVNAQEIKSVVLNMVVNALDSMDEDGTLTIKLRQHDRRAEIVFADTGCGMTPEILENIFEPFFTRSRTGKGTGLGLSISHRVITQHGGEIEATSPGPNQGSTFTVRLPLQPAESVKEETLGHAAA